MAKRVVVKGSEAVRAGELSGYQLRTRFNAVYPDVYVPEFTVPTLRCRSEAAWLWSRGRGVLAGLAAANLHGAQWIDDDEPVELILRNTQPPAGLITRNEQLDADEITRVAGLSVTTVARTAFDLGRRLPRDEAVARLDALAWATPFSIEDVLMLAKRHAGARGLRRLRTALPLVDGGAASPKETWLRLLLIDAGLPAPETQLPILDGWRIVRVADMGWRRYRVAAEYDGDHHRTNPRQWGKDIRALEKAQRLGWVVIRVIAGDRCEDIVERVHGALTRRGYRDT